MAEIIGGLGFGFAFLAIITGSAVLVFLAVAFLVGSLIVKS